MEKLVVWKTCDCKGETRNIKLKDVAYGKQCRKNQKATSIRLKNGTYVYLDGADPQNQLLNEAKIS
jgi:hypothetical protein